MEEAVALYEKNIELSRKNHVYSDLAISLSDLGNIYLIKKDVKRDLALQEEALGVIALKSWYKNYGITAIHLSKCG